MTEEIMIDGIDISGCKYAEKSIPIDCSIDNCFCYENKNCYYKQMKRLEQKLEKIKELCQVPNEPYYNSECEFGKGRIDLGQEILEIIEGAEE